MSATTQLPERAELLTVGMRVADRSVRFEYDVEDGAFHGALVVDVPFELSEAHRAMLPGIGAVVAAFLGQLCLARVIRQRFPADPLMGVALQPLVQMLYDIRCWRDGRELCAPPRFVVGDEHAERSPLPTAGDSRCGLLLWSGGKDSTLAALMLRRNGVDVQALHVTVNSGVEVEELNATRRLAQQLELPLDTLRLSHPEFEAFSGRYALNWDAFPLSNRVPFGRDLLLAALATLAMPTAGARFLSMGHDNDCRTATVEHMGRSIPRNDVESHIGAGLLERYLDRFVLPGIQLLPPLARLSEFRILHDMLVGHPDLMRMTSFCFWGGNCGRCAKCMRYYLAQRVLGREVLTFRENPLRAGACPELDDLLAERESLFRDEVVYMLGRLCERGDVRPHEERLAAFRDGPFRQVAPRLDAWEAALMRPREDPQVPAWLRMFPPGASLLHAD